MADNRSQIAKIKYNLNNIVATDDWTEAINAAAVTENANAYADISDWSFNVTPGGIYVVEVDALVKTATSTTGLMLRLTSSDAAVDIRGMIAHPTSATALGTCWQKNYTSASANGSTGLQNADESVPLKGWWRADTALLLSPATLTMQLRSETNGVQVTLEARSVARWKRIYEG